MDNLQYAFVKLAIDFVNQLLQFERTIWPYIGLSIGLLIGLAWILREHRVGRLAFSFATLLAIFEFGLYFGLPSISVYLSGQEFDLPKSHLIATVAGIGGGIFALWLLVRYSTPAFEIVKNRITRRSRVERNRKTDIRAIGVHLPDPQQKYDPRRFFNPKKGIFLGLDETRNPLYIPQDKWRKSHVDVIGTTGSGKGVAAGLALTQALSAGEAVIIIDPKNDEFLPHVMYQASQHIGVPYLYLDLQSDSPQWNPLQGKSSAEIAELFSAGFSLGEKGTDADFYRLDDRRAARVFADILPIPRPTIAEGYKLLLTQQPTLAESGKKFCFDLEELGMVPAIRTAYGVDLARIIEQGGVIYVRGSMRNPSILKLQRIFVLSMIQIIEKRERDNARHVCLFLDEFKYLISRQALEALGAIRDKRAHVILAHQSLGDLRDCPADLDPETVVSSVNENCAIKISYAVKDPDTADWLARMSGQILVDDEIRQVKTNFGLTETRENQRSLRQAERTLVDTNMLQALPERCAVLYGAGLAKFFFTAPIPVIKQEAAVTPVVAVDPDVPEQSTESSTPPSTRPVTIAQGLLDVD